MPIEKLMKTKGLSRKLLESLLSKVTHVIKTICIKKNVKKVQLDEKTGEVARKTHGLKNRYKNKTKKQDTGSYMQ